MRRPSRPRRGLGCSTSRTSSGLPAASVAALRRDRLSASDPADANHGPLKDNIARLRAATDAQGRALEVIEIEQPRARYMPDGRRIAASYINFYLANGAVIMPVFEDPQDARAFEIVGKAFPGREVVQVPAVDIVYGGGGIHCITQQQPAGTPAAP